MTAELLTGTYATLRAELDAAYAEPVWDATRIDGITERMAPIERAIAAWRLPLQTARSGAASAT